MSPLPFAVVMLALLATFLLVPVRTGPLFSIQRPARLASDPDAPRHADGSINAALVSNGDDNDNNVGDDEKSAQPQAEVDQNSDLEDFTLIQTLLQVDFWLLFFIFFAIIGAGITLVNNFAELVFSIVDVDHSIVVRLSVHVPEPVCGVCVCGSVPFVCRAVLAGLTSN